MKAVSPILLLAGLLLPGAAFGGAREDWAQANQRAAEGKFRQAVILFTRALEGDELDSASKARVLVSRGVVRRKMGDPERALDDYNRALELNPRLKEAFLNRGNLWRLQGQPGQALADYSMALELNGNWAAPYHGIAWLMATTREPRVRNPATALDMARKAIALERNANHLDTLAAALAANGMFEEAIRTQEQALSLLAREGRMDMREAFQQRLESYRAGKAWVE